MAMFHKETMTGKSKLLTSSLLLVTFIFLPIISPSANELVSSELNKKASPQVSISNGQLKRELNDQQRQNIIKAHQHTEIAKQSKGKATAKTRVAVLASQTQSTKGAKSSIATQGNNRSYDADFTIYSATSFLEEDYDGDGYYRTFSVIFDADIYSYTNNPFGEVYALLYLSKNGGPWIHYFTTDDFIIEGDTDLDEYEVITTFVSGYTSGEYDVLIDLYQVGYSDIVASFSSDDSNALYALPIESADYDQSYIEVIEVSEGGSISILLLLLLGSYFVRIQSKILK